MQKEWKQKILQGRFQQCHSVFNMITKKNRTIKVWVGKGTKYAGEFEKFFNAQIIHFYSTMNETNGAFGARTIRSKKYSLPLSGRLWVQVHAQVTAVRQEFELQIESFD